MTGDQRPAALAVQMQEQHLFARGDSALYKIRTGSVSVDAERAQLVVELRRTYDYHTVGGSVFETEEEQGWGPRVARVFI